MRFIRTLKSVHRGEEQLAGQRAVDLALLLEREYLVPPTFVLTNEAFEAFILHNRLQQRIAEALEYKDAKTVYEGIREFILAGAFPKELVQEIVEAYESLAIDPEAGLKELVSSEEAPFASVFLSANYTIPAGNREGIILNVKGLEELLLAVKEAWACLFTPAMQRHRQEAGLGHRNLNAGVMVQRMAKGELTAEASSATGSDMEQLTVRTYYGCLDIGMHVEKDEFRLTREYLKPVYQSVAKQTFMLTRDDEERLGKLPIGKRGEEQKLNDRMVIELGRLAKKGSSALESPVELLLDVQGERVETLLCTRLLLTKGAVKLQGYQAEESIEERPEPETPGPKTAAEESAPDMTEEPPEEAQEETPPEAPRVVVEQEEATVAVDEETGESDVIEQESAVTEENSREATEEPEERPEAPATESDEEQEEAAEETLPEEETANREETAPEEQPDSIFAAVEREESILETEEVPAQEAEGTEKTEEQTAAEEAPAGEERSLEEAYGQIVEALTKRYEARFRGRPPSDVKALYAELSGEVIIPHEKEIGRLIRTMSEDREYDQELEELIFSILDDFLANIR